MGTLAPLPLSDIVDVIVTVSPQLPAVPTFNIPLYLGASGRIQSWGGSNPRIRNYTTVAQMLSDGFETTDSEFICAELAFSQSPPPQSVYIGCIDETGTVIATISAVAAAGSGYAVGDILSVGGGTAGLAKVTTVSGGGVTAVDLIQDGTGYTAGTESTTAVTGSGSGCTLTITVGNETEVQALTYCRQINTSWYILACCDSVANTDAAILAMAAFAQAQIPAMRYFATTSNAAVVNNQVNNLGAQLKALSYFRTSLTYATTLGGIAPNNIYAGAGTAGVVCGLNTGLANSYATAMFKTIVGIEADPLTQTQANNLDSLFVNHYTNFANAYTFYLKGYNSDGSYIDQWTQRDMLSADIQFSCLDVLVSLPVVPLTDPGVAVLVHAVSQCAVRAQVRGYIPAGGIWEGITILSLMAGASIPGYLAQAPPVSTLTAAQRSARQSPPIYLAIIESDAVQSLLVGVYVQ